MNYLPKILCFIACTFILMSCEKKEAEKDVPQETRLNNFIKDKMKDVYYWADEIKNRNPQSDLSAEEFTKALVYSAEDKWTALLKEESSTTKSDPDTYETGMGYQVLFLNNGANLLGIIVYVYPNTPADEAGIKRGDIIVMNNGNLITAQNRSEIFTAQEINIQLGNFISPDYIRVREEKIHLTARRFEITPILVNTVIETGNKKIGYLFYTQFDGNQTSSVEDLSTAIREQKTAGIDELILDLRYNPGGYDFLVKRLCSLLAPANVVRNKSVLIKEKYNSRYKSDELRFDPSVLDDNLDLPRLYVITTGNTASASEVLISGLSPYMEVIQVGTTTYGKYVGGSDFTPEDEDLKDWYLHLITFSYTNKDGKSVKGGILPTVEAWESADNLSELGNPEEPLLKATLDYILKTDTQSLLKSKANQPSLKWEGKLYDRKQYRFIKTE